MIIWLTSYPKSGNTWVRSFLSSLMFTENGEADFEALKNIHQYPLRSNFEGLVQNLDDLNTLSENWINTQDLMNLDKKIKFLKTHHAMCNFGKYSFTNYENTFGVIQIVRDPRNIITSLLSYFSKKDYNEAKKFIFDENKIIGFTHDLNRQNNLKDNNIITLISSWKTHFNSWKNFKKNYLLIKYENLIQNPDSEFDKIRYYLKNKLNLSFSDEKFKNAIISNSFSNLKKLEKTKGFSENLISNNTKKKVNFFNLGPNNDYKNLLDTETKQEIEKFFYSEMKELEYI